MGNNGSRRRVSFEADENENVTVVKGVRLSENVINRMRDISPSSLARQPSRAPPSAQPNQPLAPQLPRPPSFEPSGPLPPPHQASSPARPVTSPPPTVDDEELRRKVKEELRKDLERERSWADVELHQRLEEETQAQVKQEVGRILDVERAVAQESIRRAILKERMTAEDERLRAQVYELEQKAQKLEERDRDLRKQDAFYKEQIAKLEERSARFYEVSTENYHKAIEEVNSRFKRYEINPICADLQGQILSCYKENSGQTLTCSKIASLYLQCVNGARQSKLRTGG